MLSWRVPAGSGWRGLCCQLPSLRELAGHLFVTMAASVLLCPITFSILNSLTMVFKVSPVAVCS